MEYAKVDLVCKVCKKEFTYIKACQNRIDADIIQSNAARRRRPLCPECQKKEMDAANLEKAAELGLPELYGRSEKQIGFAFSLRNRYVCKHEGTIRRAQKNLAELDWEKAEAIYAQKGFRSAEDLVLAAFRQKGMDLAYMCLTECNAQVIIDALAPKKT